MDEFQQRQLMREYVEATRELAKAVLDAADVPRHPTLGGLYDYDEVAVHAELLGFSYGAQWVLDNYDRRDDAWVAQTRDAIQSRRDQARTARTGDWPQA